MCAGSIQPHKALEGRGQLWRDGDDPAGVATQVPNVQLGLAMMGGRIRNVQRAQLPGSQTCMKEGQHDELINDSPGRSIASALIRTLLDVRNEPLYLYLRKARCSIRTGITAFSRHAIAYNIPRISYKRQGHFLLYHCLMTEAIASRHNSSLLQVFSNQHLAGPHDSGDEIHRSTRV